MESRIMCPSGSVKVYNSAIGKEPTMPTDSFRIGLIGAGTMGQLRARAIRSIPHARLVALAAADSDQAKAVLREQPGVRLFPDGQSLAGEADIDGVIITTAPVTHEPLGLACLRAGKHVL